MLLSNATYKLGITFHGVVPDKQTIPHIYFSCITCTITLLQNNKVHDISIYWYGPLLLHCLMEMLSYTGDHVENAN